MTYIDQIVGVYCPDVPGVRETITAIVEREIAARTAPMRVALDEAVAVFRSPEFMSVFTLAHIHGVEYKGPTFDIVKALTALDGAKP